MEYYLGLDMGTTSVGWAVTDKEYNILRAKGKDLWGIREFDEAETAVTRRTNRVARRRRQRQVVRIGMLKDYFHDEIVKADPFFYQRLENSKYWADDKDEELKSVNAFFDDENFKDKDYFKKYPTIFHLRKDLIENDAKHDIRLVFLALLNMFKHRGHFLYENIENTGRDFDDLFRTLKIELENVCELELTDFSSEELNNILEIMGCRDFSKTEKSEKVAEIFKIDKRKDKKIFELIKTMCGRSTDANIIFDLKDVDSKTKIDFTSSQYEETKESLITAIGEDNFTIIELLKSIHDISLLNSILHGDNLDKYLSNARVKSYEQHHSDLSKLKRIVKKHFPDDYNYYFRSSEKDSYSAYIGTKNSNGVKCRRIESDNEAFFKNLKKKLESVPEKESDEDILYVLDAIEKEQFLPKQLTSANGVIPNQLHAVEMEKILENAGKHYGFLLERDESGLTTIERIIQLFRFQIPYYVGPTVPGTGKKGENRWIVRKEEGRVLPWNIDDKIDRQKTSEEFIIRMTRQCTYLSGEKALPKHSLLYERYCVLNEINNLKINGEKISVELKQDIFNDLFMQGKKVTRKKLLNYLMNVKGVIETEQQLSGIDIDINNFLSSVGKFKEIFGEKIKEDKYKKIAEEIIFISTVHGQNKEIIKNEIEKNYGSELDEKQIKRITGFKFNDWGNLSKEFLEMQGCKKTEGIAYSLISMMWEENLNLMELINSDDFTYKENLADKTQKAKQTLSEVSFEDLEDYYFSNPVKRMIWQTIGVIKDIKKVMGGEPKRLFVEMTRSHEKDPKRTVSRANQFKTLYKSIKEADRDWIKEIEKAEDDGTIRSKKMYLYLTQMGRCMYSGERIELSELFKTTYDIDHIYPRHFVKDDSIESNLVLVKKEKNAHKSDNYPIETEIRNAQKAFWESLKEKGFISAKKFERLTGNAPLTDEQKADFIARQMVETSQATKGVADIIKMLLPDTEIVYAKASNVSGFRQQFDFPKSRLINDHHHDHDAYLNIVVGNVYLTKFTRNPRNFIKEASKDEKKYNYNLSRMYDRDVQRAGEVAWIAPDSMEEIKKSSKDNENQVPKYKGGTFETVRKMFSKNTPLLSRYSFEACGEISNATLYGKEKAKGDGYIPLKPSDKKMLDRAKYGGFGSVSIAYFFLVEHELRGKKVRTIEALPFYLKDKLEKTEPDLKNFCIEKLGLINPSIRLKRIKVQSLLKKNGFLMHLSGKAGNDILVRNAVNLNMDCEQMRYIKKIEKYGGDSKNIKLNLQEISYEKNVALFEELLKKHNDTIFAKRPTPCGKQIEKGKEEFKKIALEKQVKVLNEILSLTIIGKAEGDLQDIGGSKITGRMKINKKISDADEFKLICQSPTGIYSKEIDLLTI